MALILLKPLCVKNLSEDYSESPVFDSWLPLFGFVVLFLIRRLAVMDGVPRVP